MTTMTRVHDPLTLLVMAADDPTLLVRVHHRKRFTVMMHIQCAVELLNSWKMKDAATIDCHDYDSSCVGVCCYECSGLLNCFPVDVAMDDS